MHSLAIRVYPRACGGTRGPGYFAGRIEGLSPRVRGNRGPAHWPQLIQGSIPARAGEPFTVEDTPNPNQVYPRACGGTDRVCDRGWGAQGLSPRVRGNRLQVVPRLTDTGSIPARAGEPLPRHQRTATAGVYPRACGGTRRSGLCYQRRMGLSPRVRGNRREEEPPIPPCGSIPARAGEPNETDMFCRGAWVYPRACGGTSFGHSLPNPCHRSIPARAGEPTKSPPD